MPLTQPENEQVAVVSTAPAAAAAPPHTRNNQIIKPLPPPTLPARPERRCLRGGPGGSRCELAGPGVPGGRGLRPMALSRRRQLRRQSPGPQRPPTPHSRAPTLPPPSPGEGLLIYLFCWDLGGGLGWRGRGCPRALPPVAGATLGAAAAPASASGLQNCFQTASAGGPGVAAANQRAASILAVNSPQRSRLLPTQPWKICRSGRSRQCHESVTYKKALGWRRDSVPGAPVRTLPPCLDSGSRPRLALTVLPPSCQVTVMLWVWRHIWRTSAKLIPGVGVRWRVYGRAASQLLIQAAHELVSIIVVIIAGSGCREQGWAGGQLLPSSGSTWRGLRAKGTTGFPGAESQHCSSCKF
ncbi:uncharacterized protein LOC111821042 [Trichechus manatus latirostris]|uniref:Uncharacterized protein LOC111821042 n=1 Tax=Trichechus manatus latirostris TaxID=127582 RepID=A0A2Y9R4K2_TRIMA|nr:uncharacterized protein LOC111821042 [Trichechus manatus latirostris]